MHLLILTPAFYQNEKDFDSAILHFEKAVALDTSFPAAECELAVELCRAQKFEDAREHFLNALELDPNFVKAYFNYALLLVELNDSEEAKNNFDKVAEIDQNYAPAYFNKAKLLTSPDDFDEARKNYETALDIKEDYIEAHYSLAKLLLGGKATSKDGSTVDKRDWEIAKFHFRKVLQIDESSHKANYNLEEFFEENSLKEAKACLAKAIKLELKYSKAHFLRKNLGA